MATIEESLEKHQQEIQRLLLESGYQRSLIRMHTELADDLDSRIDVVAKKMRTLESNKKKPIELKEEVKDGNTEETQQTA